jgi:pSer/pThr/pTyr-binding forkhead associated (FHA) protein
MTQQPAHRSAGLHQLWIAEAGMPDRTITLSNTVTIGRDTDNDIVLATATVSRQHALLICTAAGIRLLDLESTNGTLVNQVSAPPDEAVCLVDGDMLRFGQVVARYGRMTKDE